MCAIPLPMEYMTALDNTKKAAVELQTKLVATLGFNENSKWVEEASGTKKTSQNLLAAKLSKNFMVRIFKYP